MVRFYDLAGWLFLSLGAALLVISLVLVPVAFADDGDDTAGDGTEVAPCSGDLCTNGCNVQVNGFCSESKVHCNNTPNEQNFPCRGCKCLEGPGTYCQCR